MHVEQVRVEPRLAGCCGKRPVPMCWEILASCLNREQIRMAAMGGGAVNEQRGKALGIWYSVLGIWQRIGRVVP